MSSVPFDHIHDDVNEPLTPSITRDAQNAPLSRTTTRSSPIRVAIVGGGMGGLCLALGLLQYEHLDVHVYEAAHKFAEIGAGVAFGPNTQNSLTLLGQNVLDAFNKQKTGNKSEEYQDVWFNVVVGEAGEDDGKLVTTSKNKTGQASVHRAHFLDELVKLMPPERSHFGKRLVAVDDKTSEGGAITLHFKDGTTTEADALVGADGIHSFTREFILGSDHPALKPSYSGAVAYRNLIPMDKAIAAVGPDAGQNSNIYVFNGGLVMAYPVDQGEILNSVAITFRHKTWDHKEWVVPSEAISSDLFAAFPNLGEEPKKMLKAYNKPSAWSLWDLPPAPYYNKGNVVMMGDAAHATTPFQGAGAGQAIEDALTLTKLFGRVGSTSDLHHAFAAFDEVRRERSQKVVSTSREAGMLASFQLPGVGDDWREIGRLFTPRMSWIWDKDMEEQCQDALNAFDESKKSGSSRT